MTTYDIAPNKIGAFLDANLFARPVFVWGPPAIGKTEAIMAWAGKVKNFQRLAKRHLKRRGLWTGALKAEIESIKSVTVCNSVRLGNIDLLDLGGIPYVAEGGIMRRAIPQFWIGVGASGKAFGFLYLDEYTQGGREKQTSAQQLSDIGTMGEYSLPGHPVADPKCELGLVFIIASGNRQSDRANSHGMGNQTGSRFTHVTVGPEAEGFLEGWLDWAARNGVSPVVLAFIRQMPEYLNNLKPSQKEEHPTAATPRTWVALSEVLDESPDHSVEFASYAGIVGEEAARSFLAVLHASRSIDIEAALLDPSGAEVPQEVGHQFAAASLLIRRANADNFDNVVEYVSRIGGSNGFASPEIAVFVVEAIARRTPLLAETATYRDFCLKWADIRS